MLFKNISPTLTPLQLPGLEVGELSTKYFDTINMFYETSLSADDYKVTQVFLNTDGRAALELVPLQVNGNNDILSFVSRKAPDSTTGNASLTLDNPLSGLMLDFLRVSPVWILDIKEFEFLGGLPLNTPRNLFSIGDTIPASLATLLNGVAGQPNWDVNSNATYSVAGFSVEYYGDVSTAPSEYLYPDQAKTIAILNILQGGYQGKLMVCCK